MFRSLKSALNSIQNHHRLKKYFIYDKIQKIWKQEIDSIIQENTQIINLNNNIITIQTAAPTWKTELGFQKSELLLIINKHLESRQKIKDIKFI
tara:strand:- start:17 stop:298 length:282 start_codon:yes stop_codon:yes gene_type:complete